MQLAVILALAGLSLQGARDDGPADVMVYMSGDGQPPNTVEARAQTAVKWIYERIGVRLAWSYENARSGAIPGNPMPVHVRYVQETFDSPKAFAFALPFAEEGTTSVTVIYSRILFSCGQARAEHVLAYVLAHEICHVLRRTKEHSKSGIMKPRWNQFDFDRMQRTQLQFTQDDVEGIRAGLAERKIRTASNLGQ